VEELSVWRGSSLSEIFRRILVAVAGYTDPATGRTDGELETVMERNIRYACDLAKVRGSELTLIHIVAFPIALPQNICAG
jgi:nucleotide-binding universal stress UspA family protein